MSFHRNPRAFTLVEAMLLLVIVSIVAVAAGVGLQAVAKVPAKTDDTMSVNNVMLSIMEQTKANLKRNWPGANFNGANYAFTAIGTAYTPASSTIGTTAAPGTSFSTPTTGTTPIPVSINYKTFKFTLAINEADPAGGASYKTDYFQVTVTATAYIGGSLAPDSTQMVTYVAQP